MKCKVIPGSPCMGAVQCAEKSDDIRITGSEIAKKHLVETIRFYVENGSTTKAKLEPCIIDYLKSMRDFDPNVKIAPGLKNSELTELTNHLLGSDSEKMEKLLIRIMTRAKMTICAENKLSQAAS